MADDQYAARENQYNDNIGLIVGRFATAIVEADSAAKDAYTKRVLSLVKEPNAEFVAETTLIGSKQPLQTQVSVPVLAITDSKPIQVDQAVLDLDMNVSAHQEDTFNIAGSASVEGSGRVGWGPFSVGVKITGSMSTSKEQKRSSDYRSTTHAHVEMGQGATPEGLSLIIDSLNKTTARALELNQAIIEAKLPAAAEAAAKAGDAPSPSGGDDKGGDTPAPTPAGG